jgi:hypothetical protein
MITIKTIKRSLAIILAISVLTISNVIPVSSASTSFTDVKTTSWYYSYVNKLIELKITSGIGNNKYGPDNSVTRAEFVTFLCKVTGHAQVDGYTFTDTKNHWSNKWISAAVTANIIDKGAKFNPNKAITRQEAVEMLCRSLLLQENIKMQTPYTDIKTNSGSSNTAYNEYLMRGSVTNGKRFFYPSSNIKRSEVAAVIVNAYNYKTDKTAYINKKIAEENTAAPTSDTQWSKESVDYLISKGIIQGTFNTETNITIQQYITMLVRTLGKTDVQDYIKTATELGIIQSGEFKSFDTKISRADMAKLTIKAYDKLNNVIYPDYLESYKTMVTDYKTLNSEVKQNSLKCVSEGLITVIDGAFKPNDYCNGGLAATVIHRILSAEQRNKVKPIFAIPDKEFEAFMANRPEAVKVCSVGNIDKVVDGKILWNTYEDGVTLLPTLSNKHSNKEAYESLKVLVGYARKYNHWVEAYYKYGGGDNMLQIFYVSSQKGGQMGKARTEYDFSMFTRYNEDTCKIFGDAGEEKMQKKKTDYRWNIRMLYNSSNINFHRTLEGYQEKELVEPLKAWLNIIYEPKLAGYLSQYILKDDRTKNEYYMREQTKNYEKREVSNPQQFKGLELQVKRAPSLYLGTNKIN